MSRSLAVLVCLAACARASDEGEAKQWPSQPPPHEVTVPPGLSIDVKVDGVAKPAITATTLRGAKPDFANDEHKAWRVRSIVPEAAGNVVEAVAASGVSVKFAPDELEPVLFLTRRGDVIVSAIDPKDPFPRWHDKGGRLRRAGDPMPR